MEQMATIGLDVAKAVFQVRGVGKSGSVVVQRRLPRSQILACLSA
jgi:transposase